MTSSPRIYPPLLSVFPVLTMARTNVEDMALMDLAIPLAVTLAWVGACWMVTGLTTENPDRRAIGALAGGTFLSWYGPFQEGVGTSWLLESFRGSPATETLWAALVAMAAWIAWRRPGALARWRSGLNAFALILVIFPLFGLGRTILQAESELSKTTVAAPEPSMTGSTGAPDIYLVVLDKYSSGASLRESYDHEIGTFERSLRRRGFHVPRRSPVNYVHTAHSLASLLNWDYLDRLLETTGGSDRTPLYGLIEESRARSFLAERGYRFAFFPSSYMATSANRHADLVLPRAPIDTPARTNFIEAWIASTPLRSIAFGSLAAEETGPFPYAIEHAERMDRKFDLLATMPERKGSWFVLAHLLLPHEPYLYRADCSHRRPWWPLTDRGADSLAVRRAYLEQVTCLNTKLGTLVDRLRAGPGPEPVILIQGDHGHGFIATDPLRGTHLDLDEMTPGQIEERATTFAAYHVPGRGDTLFYDGMTPVNLLPAVFDHLFGSDLERRQDRTYWTDFHRPYEHTRIR